jgi:hypothetical protein
MPSQQTHPGWVWIRVDVPKPVAAQFAAYASTQHRSSRAQLRLLLEQVANQQNRPDERRAA